MLKNSLSFKQYRWLLLAVIVTLYFLTCLHRLSPTVIARDLALSFNADALALGIISSAYFYCYSAVQPVVGYLSDTIGPRRVMTYFFGLAAIGSLIFAVAPDTTTAALGRAMIGAGVGGVFIPSLKLFSRWYRANEFASLTGVMLAIAGLAGLSATLPLTMVVLWTGWRGTFLGIAALSLVLVALCRLIIRDRPEDKGWDPVLGIGELSTESAPGSPAVPLLRRLSMVFGNGNFWKISLSTFFTAGVFLTFQGLWGVPFLMDVFDLDRIKAGRYIMLFPLGFGLGGPILGYVIGKLGLDPRKVLMCAMATALTGWIVIYLIGSTPLLPVVALLLFLFGFTGGGSLPVSFTLTRDLFPQELMGTAVGLMNTAPFLGAALYQPLTGLILNRAPGVMPGSYSPEAYGYLLILFILSCLCALTAATLLNIEKKQA